MISIRGICYIVGACGGENGIVFRPGSSDFIIAADGGYDLLKKSNIEADVLLGDFDSITTPAKHKCVIKHPVEKDDTDSFLAYKLGFKKGYRRFVIFGGIGGRMDHTVANIQMLCHMAKNDSRGFLIGENTVVTAIYNSKISFSCKNSGKIGVFAHGSVAKGVTISGLKYTLDNGTITPDFPLGVSNEFIGEKAEISVADGVLLAVWYEKDIDFLNRIETYMEELL